MRLQKEESEDETSDTSYILELSIIIIVTGTVSNVGITLFLLYKKGKLTFRRRKTKISTKSKK